MLAVLRARWYWLLGAGPSDDDGPDTVRFEIRDGAKRVTRMLMVVGLGGYGLVAVAAIVGPGLSVLVRILIVGWAIMLGAAQILWLERRGIRAYVVATPSGIRVFNGLRTHFVRWTEVEGFEPSSRPFLLAIKRTRGRPLPMAGLTPGSFGNRAQQARSLEELEAYRRRASAVGG
jgi:Bacterial PH domain